MDGTCSMLVRTESREKHTKFWSENLKRRDISEDLGVNGRVILKWILGNRMGRCGHGYIGSG